MGKSDLCTIPHDQEVTNEKIDRVISAYWKKLIQKYNCENEITFLRNVIHKSKDWVVKNASCIRFRNFNDIFGKGYGKFPNDFLKDELIDLHTWKVLWDNTIKI